MIIDQPNCGFTAKEDNPYSLSNDAVECKLKLKINLPNIKGFYLKSAGLKNTGRPGISGSSLVAVKHFFKPGITNVQKEYQKKFT